jgi:hypothetical protein
MPEWLVNIGGTGARHLATRTSVTLPLRLLDVYDPTTKQSDLTLSGANVAGWQKFNALPSDNPRPDRARMKRGVATNSAAVTIEAPTSEETCANIRQEAPTSRSGRSAPSSIWMKEGWLDVRRDEQTGESREERTRQQKTACDYGWELKRAGPVAEATSKLKNMLSAVTIWPSGQ